MKKINLQPIFNNRAITSLEERNLGELTLGGTSFPLSELLKMPVEIQNFFSLGNKDNVVCEGQIIKIHQSVSVNHLVVVGTSVYGDYSGDIIVKNKGIQKSKIHIQLNNLFDDVPFFTDCQSLISSDYLNSKDHIIVNYHASIWKQEIYLKNTITFDEIVFLDNPFLHIFSMFWEEV